MTKRYINSTERRTIPREAVDIVMQKDGGQTPRATATLKSGKLKLPKHHFPSDAIIAIEAYRKASLVRFDFGTIGKPVLKQTLELGEIDPNGAISFRIKVVKDGMILGLSPRINSREEGDEIGRTYILPLKYKDLGQHVSQVSGSLEEEPWLLLNNRIPGIQQKWDKDPVFKGAVTLAAFETVLRRLAEADSDEDDTDWKGRWSRYCDEILGTGRYPHDAEPDEKDAWVEACVNALSEMAKFADLAISNSMEADND